MIFISTRNFFLRDFKAQEEITENFWLKFSNIAHNKFKTIQLD